MKKIAMTILWPFLLALPLKLVSQTVLWQNTLGGIFDEYGNVICLDSDHNVLVAGNFRDTCYGTGYILYSSGLSDSFVQKTAPDGTIIWTKQFGNANSDTIHGLASDTSGNVYVAGTFLGSENFGNGSLNSPLNNTNFFVLKLDPNGNVLWRKAVPGYLSHRPKLTVDLNNNLFLTGVFFGQRTVSGLTMDSDDGCGYVMKFDTANGTPLWVTQFGSGSSFNGTPVAVNITTANFATDNQGNIYMTGCFRDHGRFGSQQIISSNSQANTYLMKLNSAGTILWTKTYTGATEGTSIVLDDANNIYTAGNYFGTVSINNNTYTAPATYYSAYLEKLDPDGNVIWFKNYDLNTTKHSDATAQLAIDSHANLFFKCLFDNILVFEGQSYTSQIGSNPNVVFKPQILASFDKDGNKLWAGQFENPNDNTQYGIYPDKATNIAVDDTGLYFTCGNSRFNNQNYSLQSGANIFTAKLALPYVLGSPTFQAENFEVIPNPTSGSLAVYFSKSFSVIDVHVLNSLGQRIASHQLTNSQTTTFALDGPPGIYFVEAVSEGKKMVQKVIKF